MIFHLTPEQQSKIVRTYFIRPEDLAQYLTGDLGLASPGHYPTPTHTLGIRNGKPIHSSEYDTIFNTEWVYNLGREKEKK